LARGASTLRGNGTVPGTRQPAVTELLIDERDDQSAFRGEGHERVGDAHTVKDGAVLQDLGPTARPSRRRARLRRSWRRPRGSRHETTRRGVNAFNLDGARCANHAFVGKRPQGEMRKYVARRHRHQRGKERRKAFRPVQPAVDDAPTVDDGVRADARGQAVSRWRVSLGVLRRASGTLARFASPLRAHQALRANADC
jgi:hypothetical protein